MPLLSLFSGRQYAWVGPPPEVAAAERLNMEVSDSGWRQTNAVASQSCLELTRPASNKQDIAMKGGAMTMCP